MQDLKKLAETLSSIEKNILPFLENKINLKDLIKKSKTGETETNRALQFLENKNIVKIHITSKEIIKLDNNGIKYLKEKLPERRFIEALKYKTLSLDEIKNIGNLDQDEVGVSIGILKRLNSLETTKDKEIKFKLNEKGKELLNNKFESEKFLEIINEQLEVKSIDQKYEIILNELKRRKNIIKIEELKECNIELLDIGKELKKIKIEDSIEELTSEVIRNKEWKVKNFRKYDIHSQVPTISRGRRHFVEESRNYIKRIWLDMGFKEITGPLIQTSFWCLDSLFVPQDHTAREMQDTFFLGAKNKIKEGKIPSELAKKIKAVHENGWTTGSKGWGGKWKYEKAKELLLRTHTTGLSAMTLNKLKKENLPAKFFSVGKVYRNETLDWKHLFEFHQVEGIVIDPDANLRNLLGYLKEFFKKMGYTNVKIKPSFFGYTEPSAEIFAYHPIKKQWVEVGGSGIFRPEVTKPLLGFECPVLAWGIGMERVITEYYKIEDLREIYKNDLKQLKEMKEFMK